MNRARAVLNGFSSDEVSAITGLSGHMVNYLVREGYLSPTYQRRRVRGKVRYYSYRDLVIARIIQRLAAAGVELKRLKQALRILKNDPRWNGEAPIDLLATDGRQIFFQQPNGFLVEVATNQHAFAFVLNVRLATDDLKRRMSAAKREQFSLKNEPLVYAAAITSRRIHPSRADRG